MFVGLTPEGEDAKAKTQKFIKDNRVTWVNGYGAESTVMAMGVQGIPTIFVVGRDGRVVWTGHSSSRLAAEIDKALRAPGSS